jgi:hypothetical protein
LLRTISSPQLSELLAYDLLDPIGSERDDLRAGIIAAQIANSGRMIEETSIKLVGHKPDISKRMVPLDFMPYQKEPETPQSAEQQKKLLALVKEVSR